MGRTRTGAAHSRLVWALMIASIGGILVAQERSGSRDRYSGRDGHTERRSAKFREGSKMVSQLGYFKAINADQIEFHFGEDRVFRVLENLALERIANELLNNSEPPRWSVSGTITEFQGTNYLLVRRATLKSKD